MTPGFLTKRLRKICAQAPYSDYPPAIYRIVFTAITEAWRLLLEEEGEALRHQLEVPTTVCLHELLETLRRAAASRVQGFTSRFFETVTRDGSLVSHVGQHLEKQPDLTFRLRERYPGLESSHYRGIFVECKLVRLGFPVSLYCQQGISRFVNGEYAWAMPTGVMVAYTRDGRTIPGDLRPFLANHRDTDDDPYLTRALPERWEGGGSSTATYSSIHARPHSQNDQPGDIRLHHLWLTHPESEPV